MFKSISRCYDSHTHLLATGALQKGLRLFDLQSAEDVGNLKIESHHFRGSWLVGFGWDHTKWPGGQLPTRQVLDRFFPKHPVAFSRADGHAVWLNSKALEVAGYLNRSESLKPTPAGGLIVRDNDDFPTGIFAEAAKIEVDMLVPQPTRDQNMQFLKDAVFYFNTRGFSHIRDMSGFLDQWNLLREMDLSGELALYVEENFTCENLSDFERALAEATEAKRTETPHLKARGIKFYFDGSLGSQGALLSQFYPGSKSKGMALWDLKDVAEAIERTWASGFEVCVHAIGDEAAHLILKTAEKVVSKGRFQGLLNLEHCEVLRPETIAVMKNLSIVCHMQPCHWLTDRRWLHEKLGSLYRHAFPWRSLQEAGVPIQWGSDSPIEEASVQNNLKALQESAQFGIAPISGDPLTHHSHRDANWGKDCRSVFQDGRLKEFIFDGKDLNHRLLIEK